MAIDSRLKGQRHVWSSLEDDVRERVLEEELRPGVLAQWSDPRERFLVRQR